MVLTKRSLFLLLMMFIGSTLNHTVWAGTSSAPLEQQLETAKPSFKERLSQLSTKQKDKLNKKVSKIQQKLAKKGKKPARDGVRTGLIIVGIGLVVALLGLAGIGDVLVTIGLIVLVVGLFLWLLDNI